MLQRNIFLDADAKSLYILVSFHTGNPEIFCFLHLRTPSQPMSETPMSTQSASAKAAGAKTGKAKAPHSDTLKDSIESAAQDSLDKALKSVAGYGDFVKANSEAVVESLSLASKGIEAINAEAASYFTSSLENGVAAAQAMAGANSLQDMLELQADYAKTATEAWFSELATLGGLTSSLFTKALAPINERVSATVELARG